MQRNAKKTDKEKFKRTEDLNKDIEMKLFY